jgi:hypothetical protein
MKRIRIVGLCLVAVFAISAAVVSSASAKQFPLYVPLPGHSFPIRYHGLVTTETKLETVGGTSVKCPVVHIEGEILTVHLSDTHYLFLECKESVFGSSCNTANTASGDILLLADEHLGLADEPGLINDPAILVLIPPGFGFTCGSGITKATIKVTGAVIGQLKSPTGVPLHEAEFEYKQSKGKQLFTTFLSSLGTEKLENQTLMTEITSALGTTNEVSSQEGKGSILYLPAGETVEVALK